MNGYTQTTSKLVVKGLTLNLLGCENILGTADEGISTQRHSSKASPDDTSTSDNAQRTCVHIANY